MNFTKNFISILNIAELVFGIGFFFIFIIVDPIGLKTFLLFLGFGFISIPIFRWLTLTLTLLPERPSKQIGGTLSYIIAGVYFVSNSKAVVWIALIWVLIIVSFMKMIILLWQIFIEVFLKKELLNAYEKEAIPNLTIPFVYIHAEKGMGVFFSRRLSGKVMKSLWEQQYISPKSGLSLIENQKSSKRRVEYLSRYKQRGMIVFLHSDSVSSYSDEFRKWLMKYSASFVVMRTSITTTISEGFEKEAENGYKLCPGPTFTIWIRPLEKGETSIFQNKGDQILDCSWGLQNRSLESVIAPMSNRLASNALPIFASDSRLDSEKRLIIQEIVQYAVPPVANSYLRFRLSQSDVERFMSLIDCIESIIRFSVIFLIVTRWDDRLEINNAKINLIQKNITLGSWVNFLSNFKDLENSNELSQYVIDYWEKEIKELHKRLINKVKNVELFSSNFKENRNLDWLRWFTEFRNVTRGHGVVEESNVAPFWQDLHEIFLEMVVELKPLIVSSKIVVFQDDKETNLMGWKRDLHSMDKINTKVENETFAFLKFKSSPKVVLYPLITVKDNRVMVFDHILKKEKAIVFLDYRFGERFKLQIPDTSNIDPYHIWNITKFDIEESWKG